MEPEHRRGTFEGRRFALLRLRSSPKVRSTAVLQSHPLSEVVILGGAPDIICWANSSNEMRSQQGVV